MKVRVCYTVEFTDRQKEAYEHHYGEKFNRDGARAALEAHGHTVVDDMVADLEESEDFDARVAESKGGAE